METRVALIGIMVENAESVEKLNDLLHQYRSYIIGRMGVPYREKGLSIISVVLDAPMDKISSLSGKLGMPLRDPQRPRPLRLLLTQRLLSLKPMKKNPLRPQQQEKNPPAAAGTAP